MLGILSQLAAHKRALSEPLLSKPLKINIFILIFFLHRWDLPETQAARPRGTAAQGALEPPPTHYNNRVIVSSSSSLMEQASI